MGTTLSIILAIAGVIALLLVMCLLTVFCCPHTVFTTSMNWQSKRSGFVTYKVDAAGMTWSYLQKGNPSSDNIFVFLHGFSASKESWLNVIKLLPSSLIIVPDLPGHGETYPYPSDSDYRIQTQAYRVDKFLDAVIGRSAKIHLVGCSMGGFIAGIFAATVPDRISTLTMVCPAGITMPRKSKLVTNYEKSGRNLLRAKTGEELDELFSILLHKPPKLPRSVLNWMAALRRRKSHIYDKIFEDIVLDKELLEENLHRIIAPSLVIWGEDDHIIDVSCVDVIRERMTTTLTVHVIKDSGHCVHRERSSTCAKEITKHAVETSFTDRRHHSIV